jgi:hypothetical protein
MIYLIQNAQVLIQTYHFKFLNMYKFAHDRKTLIIIVIVIFTSTKNKMILII